MFCIHRLEIQFASTHSVWPSLGPCVGAKKAHEAEKLPIKKAHHQKPHKSI